MATEEDKVNTGAVATISAVGALAMVGITWALTGFIRAEVNLQAEKVGAHAATAEAQGLASSQRAALAAPLAWVDQQAGQAHVPVERAKQLVLEDLQRDPNSATPAPPPPPPPPAEVDGGADASVEGGAAAPSAAPPGSGAPPAASEAPPAPEDKKKKKKPAPPAP